MNDSALGRRFVAGQGMNEISLPEPEPEVRLNGNRVISLDEPFLAFKVIANHADLEYIKKLGLLLASITDAMTID